jgi:hypothetical protein
MNPQNVKTLPTEDLVKNLAVVAHNVKHVRTEFYREVGSRYVNALIVEINQRQQRNR